MKVGRFRDDHGHIGWALWKLRDWRERPRKPIHWTKKSRVLLPWNVRCKP